MKRDPGWIRTRWPAVWGRLLRHRWLVAALLSLGVLATGVTSSAADTPLTDFSGKPHAIADYAGKGNWLVVMFWASDCHVCNVEARQYVDYAERERTGNVRLLGISLDGAARKTQAQAFIKRHALPFPNLIGEPEDVTARFTLLTGHPWYGTPTFLIYDPAGTLRVQQVGAVPVPLIENYIRQQERAAQGGAGTDTKAAGRHRTM